MIPHQDTDLLQAMQDFVATQLGVLVESLDYRTTLLGDLGVDGDDAHELLEAFGARFDVDLSELDFGRHFGNEGLPPWFLLGWLWTLSRGGDTPEARAGLEPVSIGDLVEAARAGRWQKGKRAGAS